MKHLISLISILFFTGQALQAQEINFGQHYQDAGFEITIEVGAGGGGSQLNFGSVPSGSGVCDTCTIELGDSRMAHMRIRGVKYLDVFVEIDADGELLLDGNGEESINFTLKTAYANVRDGTSSTGNAIEVPVSGNMTAFRIPIMSSRLDDPGGPPLPPPPPTGEMSPQDGEHYEYVELYFYGFIDVGDVPAGEYYGDINITVSYEEIPDNS